MKWMVFICMALTWGGIMSCQNGAQNVTDKVVKDSFFIGDTVIVHDTVIVKEVRYYDGKYLKRKFGESKWKQVYESYDYGFVISCPEFMEKNLKQTSESSVVLEYGDVRLKAKAYKDGMSLEEKYRELSKSANTKSMGDRYFLIAGKTDDDGCYFEKDLKMDGYWLYIRAEFPQAFTNYIDPLLQYVKSYGTSE